MTSFRLFVRPPWTLFEALAEELVVPLAPEKRVTCHSLDILVVELDIMEIVSWLPQDSICSLDCKQAPGYLARISGGTRTLEFCLQSCCAR